MSNTSVVSKIKGTSFPQFGKEVLITQMNFATLEAIFQIDENVQRKLDLKKRGEIRSFILKALESDFEFIFSPFIFSARGSIMPNSEGDWELEAGSSLYILDGQHRFKALESCLSHLKVLKDIHEDLLQLEKAEEQMKMINKLKAYPIAMQIYLHLDQKSERQLFSDLNTERREAHTGLVMKYDHRDFYTSLTRKLACRLHENFEIELNLSRISFNSSAYTSLPIMRKCLIALFEGCLNVYNASPACIYAEKEDLERIAYSFFIKWTEIFPKNGHNRKKFACGLTGIQISLAYTVFQLVRDYGYTYDEAIAALDGLKKNCTWKNDDPLFAHLYVRETRKLKNHSVSNMIKWTSQQFLETLKKRGGLIV
ncbi:DNA sulfur modification protein DndB [Bacillus sp. 1P06AnD]|uniref:DNA sulfur modification protein DndB n=1 Tax=Bacillus sp. 1P06AnD TaxID=3132208 RepID=UPI0039A31CEC